MSSTPKLAHTANEHECIRSGCTSDNLSRGSQLSGFHSIHFMELLFLRQAPDELGVQNLCS